MTADRRGLPNEPARDEAPAHVGGEAEEASATPGAPRSSADQPFARIEVSPLSSPKPQWRLDAESDAAQLRVIAKNGKRRLDLWDAGQNGSYAADAMRRGQDRYAGDYARHAAESAFDAVPGLRGHE